MLARSEVVEARFARPSARSFTEAAQIMVGKRVLSKFNGERERTGRGKLGWSELLFREGLGRREGLVERVERGDGRLGRLDWRGVCEQGFESIREGVEIVPRDALEGAVVVTESRAEFHIQLLFTK